jgi:hypothetical protein
MSWIPINSRFSRVSQPKQKQKQKLQEKEQIVLLCHSSLCQQSHFLEQCRIKAPLSHLRKEVSSADAHHFGRNHRRPNHHCDSNPHSQIPTRRLVLAFHPLLQLALLQLEGCGTRVIPSFVILCKLRTKCALRPTSRIVDVQKRRFSFEFVWSLRLEIGRRSGDFVSWLKQF